MAVMSATMNVMIKAAEKAARSLIRDFGEVEQLQVSTKGPGDFVSAADRRAEEIIHEELSRARPDYGFLMEEQGAIKSKNSDFRWIIDPLDGTTNFLHGLPHWAISIALEEKDQIIAGLIYDPVKDEMYRAERGQGAFLKRRRLRVSGRTDPMAATVATGSPRRSFEQQQKFIREYEAVMKICPGMRRFGAAALDLAYVAAGKYEIFWERDLQPWDAAAGVIIVKEAGGYVTSIDNQDNPIYSKNLIAGNQNLFDMVKKSIKAA